MCLTATREALVPYTAELQALVAPERPVGVRTFGAHALGLTGTDDAAATLLPLLDDGARPVREAALGVLVSFRGADVTTRLAAFWDDPETSVAIREQIILGMDPTLVGAHLDVFADALGNLELNSAARYKAATVLGQAGDARHLPVLEASAAKDPDPYVRERAKEGLVLLRAVTPPPDPTAAPGPETGS
jgi:HEAT repeat protein